MSPRRERGGPAIAALRADPTRFGMVVHEKGFPPFGCSAAVDLTLVVRVAGSLALVAAGAFAWRRPLVAATLAAAGAGTLAVSLLGTPGMETLALVAWPAAALASAAFLVGLSRGAATWAFLVAAFVAALLLAVADYGLVERTVDAAQAAFIVTTLGAAATLARADEPLLALALSAYPAVAVGVSLVAFDLAPSDVLGGLAALAAYGAWIFVGHRAAMALAILALPLAGMVAHVLDAGPLAVGLARLAAASLLVAAIVRR